MNQFTISLRMFCYSGFYSGRGETVALHLSVCRTNSGLGCQTGWVWLTRRNYFSPSVNRYHLWDDIQITLWCSFGCLTGETKKTTCHEKCIEGYDRWTMVEPAVTQWGKLRLSLFAAAIRVCISVFPKLIVFCFQWIKRDRTLLCCTTVNGKVRIMCNS